MKIEIREKRKKIILLIDGRTEGIYSKKVISLYKLKSGMEIDNVELVRLYEKMIIPNAKDICIKFLTMRQRTKKELIEILRRNYFSDKTIETVIKDFEGVSLIDDEKFARDFICYEKKKSKLYHRIRLKRFGIKEEIIDKVLEEYKEESAIVEELKRARKKYKDDVKKIISFLMRKGFEYEDIKAVIKKQMEIPNEEDRI